MGGLKYNEMFSEGTLLKKKNLATVYEVYRFTTRKMGSDFRKTLHWNIRGSLPKI